MPILLSIVGRSGAGKTTFLEELIPEMRRRGYRVGVIKHDAHDHFEMDREGKDTWRHRQAGAEVVAVSSPTRLGLVCAVDREYDPETLAGLFFQDVDIVFTEGYKLGNKPKIEVCRAQRHPEPMCTAADGLVALVTDTAASGDVPTFTLEAVSEVADFIVERFLSTRRPPHVLVRLDGKKLPIKSFVQDFLLGGIVGMLKTLRGYVDPKRIDITIRLPDQEH